MASIDKYLDKLDRINLLVNLLGYPNRSDFIKKLKILLENIDTDKIARKLNLIFTPEQEGEGEVCFADNPELRDDFRTTFTNMDLLDYIYAVLLSPAYRDKNKEFLRIDLLRVPYPGDVDVFWKLVHLGAELRQIQLLEHPLVNQLITSYPIPGDNRITRRMTARSVGFELTRQEEGLGRVWINNDQYFDRVPEVAWELYIGGYQPAQKWLKDRQDRQLSFENILRYQKIIVALTETDRLMKEINKIEIE